ncbi:Uncharacterised protein [uncultured archaeon]|nr:Uncharacterised protein [uncultured archaeon]
MIETENKFVEQHHNKFLQIAQDFIEVCPICKNKNISSRQRKTPKYKCQDCGNEFDDPKAKIVYTTHKQRYDFVDNTLLQMNK